jgi:hypothetical protein
LEQALLLHFSFRAHSHGVARPRARNRNEMAV